MIYFLPQKEIEGKIALRQVKIAVVGLGRVGLPLASTLAGEGFPVVGVDKSGEIVNRVNQGDAPFPDEIGLGELIKRNVKERRLKAVSELSETRDCDLIIVAVPTLIKGTEPDIDAVKSVATELAGNFSSGKVIILESTVPPFTTQDVLGKAIEEGTGLRAGKDFGLAYSPERVQAPQVLQDLKAYPKIIGAVDEKSAFIVARVYSTFASGIIKMSSTVAAEIEKVIENTYRDVNIAFANELARICEVYGVDVWEIIHAANSQPYSHILSPGLVGGHCIPMDPYYLISDASQRGFEPRLYQTARELNEATFYHIVNLIGDGVKKVTILGLSFKPEVKSFQYSHTLKLVQILGERGYQVTVHDPFWQGEPFPFHVEGNLYKAIEGSDCFILSTAHSEYRGLDFAQVKQKMRGDLVIDVRGLFDPAEVVRNGLRYKGLGRVFHG